MSTKIKHQNKLRDETAILAILHDKPKGLTLWGLLKEMRELNHPIDHDSINRTLVFMQRTNLSISNLRYCECCGTTGKRHAITQAGIVKHLEAQERERDKQFDIELMVKGVGVVNWKPHKPTRREIKEFRDTVTKSMVDEALRIDPSLKRKQKTD